MAMTQAPDGKEYYQCQWETNFLSVKQTAVLKKNPFSWHIVKQKLKCIFRAVLYAHISSNVHNSCHSLEECSGKKAE